MNGLIIQWRVENAIKNTSSYKTFPIAFSSSTSWSGATNNIKNAGSWAVPKIIPYNTSGNYYQPFAVSNADYYDDKISWIAIGY